MGLAYNFSLVNILDYHGSLESRISINKTKQELRMCFTSIIFCQGQNLWIIIIFFISGKVLLPFYFINFCLLILGTRRLTQLVVEFLSSLHKVLDLIANMYMLSLVVYVCNLSIQEAEEWASEVQGHPLLYCLREDYATWNLVPQCSTICICICTNTNICICYENYRWKTWESANKKGNLIEKVM